MISTRRMIRSGLTLLLAVGFATCGGTDSPSDPGPGDDGDDQPPTTPAANSVAVADNFFNPSSLTVSQDTTVTWNWTGGNPHTVTFDDGLNSSGTQTGGTHTRQFDQTGTFTYFCSVHGRAVMSGQIVVQ